VPRRRPSFQHEELQTLQRQHGMDSWNRGWAAADVDTFRIRGIGNVLNYYKEKYGDDAMERTFSDDHHQ